MSAFFGNMLIALKVTISPTTLSAVANATTSSVTANVSGGRGVYTYLWVSSGTGCTITSPTASTTTFTGSSVVGNTSIYCAVTDTITGNTLNTDTCSITWTAIPISQSVVISGGPVTYNGAARAYTLTGTPASPAPSGTPSTFTDAGTYNSTNISITPGSGYTLGSVTGNFVINPASISGTAANTIVTFNGSLQSAVVITGVSPAGATYSGSLSASGTNAGSYTSSITGTGNYTGTINGGTLTINPVSISGTATNQSVTFNGSQQSAVVITGVSPAGATYSGSLSASGTNAGSYTSSITGTGNYTGTINGGTFTISRLSISSMLFTLNGASFTSNQSRTAGTTYTIAVSSVNPSGASYSPSSLSRSTAGSSSLTSSGTGNYQGSFTSPVLTLTNPPPALSVSLPFLAAAGTTTQTMPTTINGGVPPYSLVSWVKNSGSGIFGTTSVNSAVVNKQISVNTNFVCTVTIRDSVGTTASGSGTINWNIG